MWLDDQVKQEAGSGLAGWLLGRLRGSTARPSRLALVERIALGPRQALALVEADGFHLLVATSPDGAPTFYSLDGKFHSTPAPIRRIRPTLLPRMQGRVSW